MSKIGKKPIKLPQGVEVSINGQQVTVKGPKGSLVLTKNVDIEVAQKDGEVSLLSKDQSQTGRSLYGTTRALLANMVEGVSKGWSKQLELVGTGYRADTTGQELNLIVGYSHPVKIKAPKGISFKVEKAIITVEGLDRCLVGQTAADIRKVRPPEPYKGKGIKYVDEVIRRKAGKAAKTAGAA